MYSYQNLVITAFANFLRNSAALNSPNHKKSSVESAVVPQASRRKAHVTLCSVYKPQRPVASCLWTEQGSTDVHRARNPARDPETALKVMLIVDRRNGEVMFVEPLAPSSQQRSMFGAFPQRDPPHCRVSSSSSLLDTSSCCVKPCECD